MEELEKISNILSAHSNQCETISDSQLLSFKTLIERHKEYEDIINNSELFIIRISPKESKVVFNKPIITKDIFLKFLNIYTDGLREFYRDFFKIENDKFFFLFKKIRITDQIIVIGHRIEKTKDSNRLIKEMITNNRIEVVH